MRRPREPCTAFYEWEAAIMNETAYIQETRQADNSRPAPSVSMHVATSPILAFPHSWSEYKPRVSVKVLFLGDGRRYTGITRIHGPSTRAAVFPAELGGALRSSARGGAKRGHGIARTLKWLCECKTPKAERSSCFIVHPLKPC